MRSIVGVKEWCFFIATLCNGRSATSDMCERQAARRVSPMWTASMKPGALNATYLPLGGAALPPQRPIVKIWIHNPPCNQVASPWQKVSSCKGLVTLSADSWALFSACWWLCTASLAALNVDRLRAVEIAPCDWQRDLIRSIRPNLTWYLQK